jgi:exonuclease III
MQQDQIKIVTFNLHGFNQGRCLVEDLCSEFDLLFLQEHWLAPFELDKFANCFPKMVCYASSSMDTIISRGILKGRPFGGVAVLVSERLKNQVKLVKKADRFIILRLNDTALINVYLPCQSGVNWQDEAINCISSIDNELQSLNCNSIIMGGDMNIDFNRRHPLTACIDSFCNKFKLKIIDDKLSGNLKSSFIVEASGASSLIDHFAISDILLDRVVSTCIIDSGINLSDHCPVTCCVVVPLVVTTNVHKLDTVSESLRWDKADLSFYYSTTEDLLSRIAVPFLLLNREHSDGQLADIDTAKQIEKFYSDIVDALKSASSLTVPKCKNDFFKFWWDEELCLLKEAAIASHRVWSNAGRSRSGALFNSMQKDKKTYKLAIRIEQKNNQEHFTDSLSDALLYKDMGSFWKSWRSKFGKHKVSSLVEGESDPNAIVKKFADLFQTITVPNSEAHHKRLKHKFEQSYIDYEFNVGNHLDCSVHLVADCLAKLKWGKAAGCDGLMTEHLVYAHPLLVTLLSLLFQLILDNGVVPSKFGEGIIIPLIKDHDGDVTSCANYRGITISPIISKVFEQVIMSFISDKLLSSTLQFGFKTGSSCSNAIFALRSTIKHFSDNGSNITLCALDVSKAFDRVDRYALLTLLMNRKIPKCVISIFLNWFESSVASVRWAGVYSTKFPVLAGVRQGGLISPLLFSVYMDELIDRLKLSGFGCKIRDTYLGCLAYADDIVLLSQSVTTMQHMLAICDVFAKDFDLKFNTAKSMVLRIGKRFNVKCANLILSGNQLEYVNTIKYLGVYIKSSVNFKCSYDNVKHKFYRSFNAILSKSANSKSELVSVELFRAYCLPLLLYAVEATLPTRQDVRILDNCINLAIIKIFKVSDCSNINCIRENVGLSNLWSVIECRQAKFINKIRAQQPFISILSYSLY